MTALRSALLLAQPSRRRDIANALALQGVAIVGEADGTDVALTLLQERRPSLLVVELHAEGTEPEVMLGNERVLAFVRAARELAPELRVVAVTDALEPGLVAYAVANGVDTCITALDS